MTRDPSWHRGAGRGWLGAVGVALMSVLLVAGCGASAAPVATQAASSGETDGLGSVSGAKTAVSAEPAVPGQNTVAPETAAAAPATVAQSGVATGAPTETGAAVQNAIVTETTVAVPAPTAAASAGNAAATQRSVSTETTVAVPATAAQKVGYNVGEHVPDFYVRRLDGTKITSEEILGPGRPVFLYFFTTW